MGDVAITYAQALLTAAQKEDVLMVVTEELRVLSRAFSQSAQVFSSSLFPIREQMTTVSFVLEDRFHPLTKRFMNLLVSMRRLGSIGRISAAFEKMANREIGLIDLYFKVYTEPAPEMELKLVKAACEKGLFDSLCRENMNIYYEVDKRLLGGFIAECNGMSWDCSLHTRFIEMAKIIRK